MEEALDAEKARKEQERLEQRQAEEAAGADGAIRAGGVIRAGGDGVLVLEDDGAGSGEGRAAEGEVDLVLEGAEREAPAGLEAETEMQDAAI